MFVRSSKNEFPAKEKKIIITYTYSVDDSFTGVNTVVSNSLLVHDCIPLAKIEK